MTQPQDYSLDSPEKVVSQKAVENSVPHLLKPQVIPSEICSFKQTQNMPEKEPFSFDSAIVNLQSKLHQVQMENVVLSDLR